jgi:hypothetical protein
LATTTLKDADNSDAGVGTKKLSAPNMPIVQGNFLVVPRCNKTKLICDMYEFAKYMRIMYLSFSNKSFYFDIVHSEV